MKPNCQMCGAGPLPLYKQVLCGTQECYDVWLAQQLLGEMK